MHLCHVVYSSAMTCHAILLVNPTNSLLDAAILVSRCLSYQVANSLHTDRCARVLAIVVNFFGDGNEIQIVKMLVKFAICGAAIAAKMFQYSAYQMTAAVVLGSPAVYNIMRVDTAVGVMVQRKNRRLVAHRVGIPDRARIRSRGHYSFIMALRII